MCSLCGAEGMERDTDSSNACFGFSNHVAQSLKETLNISNSNILKIYIFEKQLNAGPDIKFYISVVVFCKVTFPACS